MSFLNFEPFDEKDITLMNVLQIAYIGDAVWALIVRDHLIRKGMNVHHMHSESVRLVNAHAQASFIQIISPFLAPSELDLIRRGRNAHARHPAPKNQNPEDYSMATAFEVLIGYHYLAGNEDRIQTLANLIIGGNPNG